MVNWKQRGLALIGLGLGVLFAAGLGLYTYIIATMTPLRSRWRANKRARSATTGTRWAGWWRLS